MPDTEVAAASIRTRERSLALCKSSLALTDRTRQTRIQIREARRLRVWPRAARDTVRRESIIARKLRTGRLPCASAAVIVGKPGDGGTCDGCDQPLKSAQLVMAIPSGQQTFAHLHAECFSLWNAIRPHAGDEKIA